MQKTLELRARILKKGREKFGPILYWMSRDQRVSDNWALLFALEKAKEVNNDIIVAFALSDSFLNANLRHYDFLLKGLTNVQHLLAEKGIQFLLLTGNPIQEIARIIEENDVSILVSDFDPLQVKQQWKVKLNELIDITHFEVDAHNLVPCWIASNKQEFGAYTFRPKVKKLIPTFFEEFPEIKGQKIPYQSIDIDKIIDWLNPDMSVKPIKWLQAGEENARVELTNFINARLNGYSIRRNDPNENAQSNLSPYLHFGQISVQRVAIEVSKAKASEVDKAAFLEELIVRKELSDNFCFYNSYYSSTEGFHSWAKETHRIHKEDRREFMYNLNQFEQAKTHDKLWNAAQTEMLKTGKMHGYMRMYWAKKILEWTSNVDDAMRIAIYLNDKYSIDGRDPNGYTGIAWSIGGVHDRAWNEREVFGKIRYMNYNGCKKKFDVDKYIKRIASI